MLKMWFYWSCSLGCWWCMHYTLLHDMNALDQLCIGNWLYIYIYRYYCYYHCCRNISPNFVSLLFAFTYYILFYILFKIHLENHEMSFGDTFTLMNECRLPLCSYVAFSKLRQMGYIVRRHNHYPVQYTHYRSTRQISISPWKIMSLHQHQATYHQHLQATNFKLYHVQTAIYYVRLWTLLSVKKTQVL